MLNKSIRILNFDDSVVKQSRLISTYEAQILDLKDYSSKARLWMSEKTQRCIQERIRQTQGASVTFLGSGDFHHLSSILMNSVEYPFCAVIFDFHPDWDILPPHLGCGSWVNQILKNKKLLKCILIGVSSSDISTWSIQSANLDSLKDDMIEIYPYSHSPSSVFLKKIHENVSLKAERGLLQGKIYWNGLKGKDLTEVFSAVLKRLPAKQVYISIDKDCLKSDYALTNWEEGLLTLEELLTILKLIKENLDIVGMDITGDYSRIDIREKFKAILSRLDHPKNIAAQKYPESFINATNESTNLKILELLHS